MGTLWPKSGFVERDDNDIRAGGALAYFFVGGTTTPLTVYQDADESTPHTHPVVADANGRWSDDGAVFIPYCASYDVKVTTAEGTELYYHVEIPNPDPVEQAANTPAADELIATGHVHWEPINTTKAGYVRCNGRTVGSASSGASERANADAEDLFLYLWNNLANGQAAVSTGRGASAAADWAANKTIAVLDLRCSAPMGVADMGSTTATGFAAAPFTHGASTTAGSLVGANTHALTTAELATHLHAAGSIVTAAAGAHNHALSGSTGAGTAHTHAFTGALADESSHTHTGTTGNDSPGHTHTYVTAASKTTDIFIPDDDGNGTLDDLWRGGDTSATSGGVSINHTHGFTTGGGSAHTHGLGTLANANESLHTHALSGNVSSAADHTHAMSGSTANTGSGTAHNNVSLGLLGTFFIHL